uniref:Cystatin domain-containing protein n=1 Tax=Strongyloides stercoralis TaxID=6248 RepID=A0A0K0E3S9_STRER
MSRQGMTGGWTEQSVNDTDIIQLAQKSVDRFNQQSNDLVYHGFVKVLSAKSQVVAGMNYELQILIGKTDTLKNKVSHGELTEEQKKVKSDGPQQIITVGIWSKPWEDFEEITFKGIKQA